VLESIDNLPQDCAFFLAEADTPVAVHDRIAYRFKVANEPPEAKAVEPGIVARWSPITAYEFRVRVVLPQSQLFVVNGVAIALQGFAGAMGTAFDAAQQACRDVTDDERLAIEQGTVEKNPSNDRFVEVALHGDPRGGDGNFTPGMPF
jgi:hypothetical protein